MKIPKDQIMQLLKSSNEPGDQSKAGQAEQELPSEVDTENSQHQSMLEQYGIDVGTLVSKLGSQLGGKFGL